MTGFASEIFDFIDNVVAFRLTGRFVAFITGDVGMGTVKRKLCVVVVEPLCFPVFKGVAGRTVCQSKLLKLAMVYILMAGTAGHAHIGKLLLGNALVPIRKMTASAIGPGMLAQQFEPGTFMIKANLAPAAFFVATFTTGLWIKLLIQVGLMNVFMTIDATTANIPEVPFYRSLMAGKAGRGQVGPVQGKPAGVMLFNGKTRAGKSFIRMAIGAVGLFFRGGKLILVVVVVAIHTFVMRKRIRIACFMAGIAIDITMFPLQLKVGEGMVEIGRLFYRMKRHFGMALDAVLAKAVVVDVGMTAGAIVVGNTRKFLEFLAIQDSLLMACLTGYLLVLPAKRKCCFFVTEF